jgi:hypothetical protein
MIDQLHRFVQCQVGEPLGFNLVDELWRYAVIDQFDRLVKGDLALPFLLDVPDEVRSDAMIP